MLDCRLLLIEDNLELKKVMRQAHGFHVHSIWYIIKYILISYIQATMFGAWENYYIYSFLQKLTPEKLS